MTEERRRFTRTPFDASVQLSNTRQKWTAHLIDISLHGVLVELPEPWTENNGNFLMVDLKLGEGEGAIDICMETSVVHIHNNQLGLETVNLDLDSITHLRRLLEINLGDPELVNRELAELGK
ncbi:MAG: PilZ domain-containing protein [Gammaproteobacteria bacterium]|nr:PilZ domain-containing protein [Gammaproteobacteria bacterium]